MDNKKTNYIVTLPGASRSETWDSDKFERNREKLYEKYPDVSVQETSIYDNDTDDIAEGDSFEVTLPGARRSEVWDSAKFSRNREKLYGKYPDVSVSRIRAYNPQAPAQAQPQTQGQAPALPEQPDDGYQPTEYDNVMAEISAFDQDNAAFMSEYEDRFRNYGKIKSVSYSPTTGVSFPLRSQEEKDLESYLSQNRKSYDDKKQQREALIKKLHNTPQYQEGVQSVLSEIDKIRSDVNRQWTEEGDRLYADYRDANFWERMARGEKPLESEDTQNYAAAIRLLDDARKITAAPSRYDDTSAFYDFARGTKDTMSDVDFWNFGLTEIQDNMQIRGVLQKVQDKLGNVKNLSEEDIDDKLSESEKAVLQAFAINAQAQAGRSLAGDLSRAYQSGMSFAESIPFMAEFAMTGGIGKAASSVAKKAMTSWLTKRLGTMAEGFAKKATKAAGKAAIGAVDTGIRTVVQSALSPSTMRNVSEQLTTITDEGKLMDANKAFVDGAVDNTIEINSEMMGPAVSKVIAAPFKALMPSFAKKAASGVVKSIGNAPWYKAMKAGGWNGLPEEMLEEWYGNILRALTGNTDALKDFATVDQQLVTLGAFIPMTAIGSSVSTAQFMAANKRMKNAAAALKTVLMDNGYTEEQANYLADYTRMQTPQQMSENLTPIINQLSLENNDKAASDMTKAAFRYMEAVQRYQTFDGIYQEQEGEQRQAMQAEIQDTLGGAQFWQDVPLKDGSSKREVTMAASADGDMVYVVSQPDANGQVAVIHGDGRKGFANVSDLTDSATQDMDTYLSSAILTRREEEDAARMETERQQQIADIQASATVGSQMNLGTQEAPVMAQILQTSPDGVIVQPEDGSAPRQLSWDEYGQMTGMQPVVRSQAAIDNDDADTIVAEQEARIAEQDGIVMPEAQEDNAVVPEQGTTDSVEEVRAEQENLLRNPSGYILPVREDGKVNATALWNDNPAEWAVYNDRRIAEKFGQPDGGAASRQYITNAISTLDKSLKQLEKKRNSVTDFDEMESIEDQMIATTRRIQALNNVLASYVPQQDTAVAEQTVGSAQRQEQARQTIQQAEAGFPSIQARWNNAQKIKGAEDQIILPDGTAISGRYVLTDAFAPTASHNPEAGFAMSEGFPVDEKGKTVNDRDYQNDKAAQDIVMQRASDYDSRALQSPVIVSNDGVVLSGNDRTMSSQVAARQGTDKKYTDYLSRYSQKYGFTPEQVAQFSNPRVVFVPSENLPYDTATFAKFNQRETKGQDKTEAAVKAGKVTSEETMAKIAGIIDGFDTISEVYRDSDATRQILDLLVQNGAITANDVPALMSGDQLSGAGEDLIESILVGNVLEEEALRVAMSDRAIRRAILSAIGPIITNRSIPGYNLTTELTDAVILLGRAKREYGLKQGENIAEYMRQQNLFGDNPVAEATVQILADSLNKKESSTLRKVLSYLNEEGSLAASGQLDIFSGETRTKEDILTEILNNLGYETRTAETTAAEPAGEQTDTSIQGVPEGDKEGQVGSERPQISENLKRLYDIIDNAAKGNAYDPNINLNDVIKSLSDEELDMSLSYLGNQAGETLAARINISDIGTRLRDEIDNRKAAEDPETIENESYEFFLDKYRGQEIYNIDFEIENLRNSITRQEGNADALILARLRGELRAFEQIKEEQISKNKGKSEPADVMAEARKAAVQQQKARIEELVKDMGVDNVVISTTDTLITDMIDAGCSDNAIDVVRQELAAGSNITGFTNNGRIFIVADNNQSIASVRDTIVHERQHLNVTPEQIQQVVSASSREELQAIVRNLSGGQFYDDSADDLLADELLAFSAEIAYNSTPETLGDNLRKAGIKNERIINIITEIHNGQRTSESLSETGRPVSGEDGQQGGVRRSTETAQGESGKVAGQGLRSDTGSTGEPEEKTITKETIQSLPIDQSLKDGAIAYLDGNRNLAVVTAYEIVEDYVRNSAQSGAGNSTDADTTLMGGQDNDASGRGGRQEGIGNTGLDSERGEENVSGDGQGRAPGEGSMAQPSGKGGDTEVEGTESMEGSEPAGNTKRGRGGRVRGKGRDGQQSGRQKRGKGIPAADGTGESQSADDIISTALSEIEDILTSDVRFRSKDSSTSIAKALGPKAISLFPATAKLGYGIVQKGIYQFNKWTLSMHNNLDALMKKHTTLSDEQLDAFIESMWEYPFTAKGETHTIQEWASMMEREKLREMVNMSIAEKRKMQKAAESIDVKVADLDNIRETLPFLLPLQQEDVLKAETQFFDDSHSDAMHGYGKGYMFTNGTGTGKTYTGLGIVKRFLKQGKGRILIVTAQEKKIEDWISDAKNLGIKASMLENTSSKGSGVVVTQYANIRQNYELLKDEFDLIVYDESHKLMENQAGQTTATVTFHNMLANRDVEQAILRKLYNTELWQSERKLKDELAELTALDSAASQNVTAELNREIRKRGGIEAIRERINTINRQLNNLDKRKKEELDKAMNDPAMREEAENAVARTKVVFLSATPFNTALNLDYVEGYIFSYSDKLVRSEERERERGNFIMEKFPSSHARNSRNQVVRRSEAAILDPNEAVREEIAFSDYLQNELHTMSGRSLDSDYDYSRQFPLVDLPISNSFNAAVQSLANGEYRAISKYFDSLLNNYPKMTALFEAIKTAGTIERIKQHLALGRKVVVFHRRVSSTEELVPPFAEGIQKIMKEGNDQDKQMAAEFSIKFNGLLRWEQSIDLSFPQDQITRAFATAEDYAEFEKKNEEWMEKMRSGAKRMPSAPKLKAASVGLFNGTEPQSYRTKIVEEFNKDDSKIKVLVVQVQSGKEGISLHDTTGEHQRVEISLQLPQSPIEFIQAEGRIYRVGNKSNAIFEYPLLGIDLELSSFAGKINGRSQTSENLALGSTARGLRDSIARAALASRVINVSKDQGVGGKMLDNRELQEASGYDNSMKNYTEWADTEENTDFIDAMVPDYIGYKMNEWANLENGEVLLVPNASLGTVARYSPTSAKLIALEPNLKKYSKLITLIGGGGRKVESTPFESFSVINKADVVIIKPNRDGNNENGMLNSSADIIKSIKHVNDGGRVIALVRTSDVKKINSDVASEYKNVISTAQIDLPASATNGVKSSIVVFDRIDSERLRTNATKNEVIDFSDLSSVKDLFEKLRYISVPGRTIDKVSRIRKKVDKIANELVNNKIVDNKRSSLGENKLWISFKRYSLVLHLPVEKPYSRYRNFIMDYARIANNDFEYIEQTAKLYVELDKIQNMSQEELNDDMYSDSKYFDSIKDAVSQMKAIISAALNKTSIQIKNIANGEIENKVSGDYTFEDFKEVFLGLNNAAEDTAALGEKVFNTASRIEGLKFSVADKSRFSSRNTVAHYVPSRNIVELNSDLFNSYRISDAAKAQTIIHELIHAVTCYAMDQYEKGNTEMLSETQRQACKDIYDVYDAINTEEFRAQLRLNSNMDDNAEYGLTNAQEMVAELSNPVFRAQLKVKKLWRQIINGIKRILGMNVTGEKDTESDAATILENSLEKLMDEYNPELYRRYTRGYDSYERTMPEIRFRAVEMTPETRNEIEKIDATARVNGTYLKAPNGADTNLTPEQWSIVRTKAFKDWFGDWENNPSEASKVIDENGEPRVVYHGTPSGGFNVFDNTRKESNSYPVDGYMFATNRKVADGYAISTIRSESGEMEGKAINPEEEDLKVVKQTLYDGSTRYGVQIDGEWVGLSFADSPEEALQNARDVISHRYYRMPKSEVKSVFVNLRNPLMIDNGYWRRIDDYITDAKNKGNDGVIINGIEDYAIDIRSPKGEDNSDIIAFAPNQIKSATDNAGLFSEKTGDIRFRVEHSGSLEDVPEKVSLVERTYRENGYFNFTGKEKIKTVQDVAFIFKQLEDYAIENVFIAMIKDGKPIVVHVGMGNINQSIIDFSAIKLAYDKIHPDAVYMVHNHPSGQLVASQNDVKSLKVLKDMFPENVVKDGIIINTVSGQFLTFNNIESKRQKMPIRQRDVADIKVLSFDKNVFSKDYKPGEFQIRSSEDVAKVISSQRFGTRGKVSYLVMNNQNQVIGNIHSTFVDVESKGVAEDVASNVISMGGSSSILYGTGVRTGYSYFSNLQREIKRLSGGSVTLLDAITTEGNVIVDTVSEENPEYDSSISNIQTSEEDTEIRFRNVTDPAELDMLNSQPTIKAYRAMQVIDGKLYPPMAASIGGKMVDSIELGAWEKAVENPDLAVPDIDRKTGKQKVDKNGEPVWKFILDKGGKDATGKKATQIPARYNPYIHTSRSPLNDQFKSAWIRPNLVTVEVEVPESELTSGYKAERAKDAVGEVEWKSGSVSGQLAEIGKPRKVILSRWDRPVRVLSNEEVAERISELIGNSGISIPENVVTPSLRTELEKKGIRISDPEKGVKKTEQIKEAIAAGLLMDNDVRFSESDNISSDNETTSGIKSAAQRTADSIGVPIEFVKRSEMPQNGRYAQGYYTNGKVFLCTENISNAEEASMTVLHEAVGHKGMRRLVGPNNMDRFTMKLFENSDEETRREILALADRHGWRIGEAVEEYIAQQAETMDFNNKVKQFFVKVADLLRDMLDRIGIRFSRPLSLADTRWLLWNSYNSLNRDDVFVAARRAVLASRLGYDMRSVKEAYEGESAIRMRQGTDAMVLSAARLYNRKMRSSLGMLREVYQDQFRSVEKLVDAVSRQSNKPVEDWENVMYALNRLSSINYAEKSAMLSRYFEPMWKTIGDIMDETGVSFEDVNRYVQVKSGLERNEVFAKRDARNDYRAEYDARVKSINSEYERQVETSNDIADMAVRNDFLDKAEKTRDKKLKNAEDWFNRKLQDIEDGTDSKYLRNRENDYSGLMAWYSTYDEIEPKDTDESEEEYQARVMRARHPMYDTLAEAEDAATTDTKDFETRIGSENVTRLWDLINGANKATLKHQLESGMISKELYDILDGMMKYYVPLRGFADSTAEDIYTYFNEKSGTGFANPVMAAKGRKTMAESPFGWMATMMESAIQADNKNKAKMALYYFVTRRPGNDLISISKTWYEKTGTTDDSGRAEYVEVYPEIKEGMTPYEVSQAVKEFNDEMWEKAKKGDAFQGSKRLRLSSGIVNIKPSDKPEHVINVMIAGEKYSMIVNGNPRAAQAINGFLNRDNSRSSDKAMEKVAAVTRYIAMINTSLNPEFMMRNFMRDMGFSFMGISTKEGGEYTARYAKNWAKSFRIFNLIRKHKNGVTASGYYEKMYEDFINNGGVTGYTKLVTNVEYEDIMAKFIKRRKFREYAITKALKGTIDGLNTVSEGVENISRFAAFLTSREMGRSIERSIKDAKEVTVNFNTKGSGKSLSWEEVDRLNFSGSPAVQYMQKVLTYMATLPAPFVRSLYVFFNASVQGLANFSRIVKTSPVKASAWIAAAIAVGFLNALMHALMDDDDDYLQIPDYERRTNVMLGSNGYYFKWALPQEAVPFFGMGDILANMMMGKARHKNVPYEIAESFMELLPLNPLTGEGGLREIVPSALQPFWDVYSNQNFLGSPIYRNMPWDEDDPAYKRVFNGTSPTLISISEGLNTITGGDYSKIGWIGNGPWVNPASWEHILESYTGGIGTFFNRLAKTGRMAFTDEEMNWRNVPFVNKIFVSNDDRYKDTYVNDVYFYWKDEAEETAKNLREYRKARDIERYGELRKSPEYRRMKVYESYQERIETMMDRIKDEADEQEKKRLNAQLDEIKRSLNDAMVNVE